MAWRATKAVKVERARVFAPPLRGTFNRADPFFKIRRA
jgi:hypothetical protein